MTFSGVAPYTVMLWSRFRREREREREIELDYPWKPGKSFSLHPLLRNTPVDDMAAGQVGCESIRRQFVTHQSWLKDSWRLGWCQERVG